MNVLVSGGPSLAAAKWRWLVIHIWAPPSVSVGHREVEPYLPAYLENACRRALLRRPVRLMSLIKRCLYMREFAQEPRAN
jgi:hypothetical protein